MEMFYCIVNLSKSKNFDHSCFEIKHESNFLHQLHHKIYNLDVQTNKMANREYLKLRLIRHSRRRF